MRVCIVSRELQPFLGGGIGTYVLEMARAWSEGGHETHVLTAPYPDLTTRGREVLPGVHLHAIRPNEGVTALDAYPCHPMQHIMGDYLRLLELHERHPFDYIEFSEYWGEAYFALRARDALEHFDGAKIALRLHTPTEFARELNYEFLPDIDCEYLEHMERDAYARADALISPSESLLQITRERFPSARDVAGTTIRYPFRLSDELPPKPDRRDETREVLYFGRLERRKGVDTLIDAAQSLLRDGHDLRFRFIGGDTLTGPFGRSMREHLDRRIDPALADHLIFEPARPRDELTDAIVNADVCCFPSRWENFPCVCLESLALGAVVVGSRAGGMGELIEHAKSGFNHEPGNAKNLAFVLLEALEASRTRRDEIAVAARDRLREMCDPPAIVRDMEAYIDSLPTRERQTPAHAKGETPSVSIIVPFYNLAEHLPATLEAVRAQTVDDYELIVVDDGSTDTDAIELIDSLERTGVHVVRKPNGGLSSARNAGLAVARGRWVLPLDADDLIAPDYLEKTLGAAARNPGARHITTLVRYFVDDPNEPTGGYIPFGLDERVLPVRNCAGACTALIDAEMLREVGGYDEWLTSYEDWDVFMSMCERGAESVVIPEFLFSYRVRPDSMLRTIAQPRVDLYRAYLIQKHPGLAERGAYSHRLLIGEVHELRRHLAHAHRVGNEVLIERDQARAVLTDNLRYRLADRMNHVLKSVKLQAPVKALLHSSGREHKTQEES